MKLSFLYIILLIDLAGCTHSKKTDTHIIQTNYHSNGKVKSILSLNSDSAKDGECFYFDEDGYTDSSVTFSNGSLNGIKKYYHANYGTYTYEYKNGSLIKYSFYDTLGILRYETPLDFSKISKATYKFNSNRDYFDRSKQLDTIKIITKGLPNFNRGISITGGFIGVYNDGDKDESYILKTSKDYSDFKELKIKIQIYQHLGDSTETPFLYDSLLIPIR